MLKRALLLVIVTVVIATVFGCHSAPVALSPYQSSHGFKLYGNFTKFQQEALDELVGILPLPMIKAITFIAKVDIAEHFDRIRDHTLAFSWHTLLWCTVHY